MAYPILAARHAPEIGPLFVSTDCDEISSLARSMGAEIIHRPQHLCTPQALGEDAFAHGFQVIRERAAAARENIEMIVLLMCNAPTILSSTLREGIRALRDRPDLDSAVTVSRYNMWSPVRARKIGPEGVLDPFVPLDAYADRSTVSCDRDSQGDVWFADMGVSIVRPRCLENLETGVLPQRWMGLRIYPLRQWGGLDVDYSWQIPQVEGWLKAHGFSETATPYDAAPSAAPIREAVPPSQPAAPLRHLSGIRRVEDRDPEGPSLVRLHRNEPGYLLPPQVIEDFRRAISGDLLARYPDVSSLRDKIVASPLVGAGGLSPSQVILSFGAEGAIRHAFESFVAPGEPVVFLDPTYAMVPIFARLYQARAVPIPHGKDLQPDLNRLRESLERRPRMVILANPNSPTGAELEQTDLRNILGRAAELGVAVLVDEAYHLFSSYSVLPWVKEYPNLLVCRSFSKAMGLPSLRFGFLAFHETLAGPVSSVRCGYETTGVAAAWVQYLLDHDSVVRDGVSSVLAGKAYLESEARRRGFRVFPTRTNFSLLSVGVEWVGAMAESLRGEGFLVRRGFDAVPLNGCLRVSSSTLPVMRAFLDAFERSWASVARVPKSA